MKESKDNLSIRRIGLCWEATRAPRGTRKPQAWAISVGQAGLLRIRYQSEKSIVKLTSKINRKVSYASTPKETFTLNQYTRIFSALINAGASSTQIQVQPLYGVGQAGLETLVVKLTPHGPAHIPPTNQPRDWAYVLDLNKQSVSFNLRQGLLINLRKDADGYLSINPTSETSPLPFLNLANSARGTVARIYTGTDLDSDPSQVRGEYYSAPLLMGRNPSRTTVDRYGNVWVGNRDQTGQGSIVQIGVVIGGQRGDKSPNPGPDGKYHITRDQNGRSWNPDGDYLEGPFIYNTCADRDEDGLIKTSRGTNLLPWPSGQNPDDEAVLRYVRVVPTEVRSLAIDKNNRIWVGSVANRWHQLIDGETATPMTGYCVDFRGGGYGGVVNGDGTVWSALYSPTFEVGDAGETESIWFLPGETLPIVEGGIVNGTRGNYGIAVDPASGDVWQPEYAEYASGRVTQFRADGCRVTTASNAQLLNRGMVIDGDSNIWIGGSGGTIAHMNTQGAWVGSVPMLISTSAGGSITATRPYGVAMDSFGFVWAVCENSGNGYAVRIDPNLNPDNNLMHDPPIGRVVEAVNLGAGSSPYNYSDMTGFVVLGATQHSGVWDYVDDGIQPDTLWSSVDLDATVPEGAKIVVEVRAANCIAELTSWPFRAIIDAQNQTPTGITPIPFTIKGRYIEVRTSLLRGPEPDGSPILKELLVTKGQQGCAVSIASHPTSRTASNGDDVTFTTVAVVPPGDTPTYQWKKDGTVIQGQTSSTLALDDVDYTDAGVYTVQVGSSSCTSTAVESAPARLHIEATLPTITTDLDGTPLAVPAGQTVVLTAGASGGSGVGEAVLFCQWRLNNRPIGDPVLCNSAGIASYTITEMSCTNAGGYSAVFWNKYGQVCTRTRKVSVAGGIPVVVSPTSVVVTDPMQVVTLEGTTCRGGIRCIQWFLEKGG